jgi:hypothetical protein
MPNSNNNLFEKQKVLFLIFFGKKSRSKFPISDVGHKKVGDTWQQEATLILMKIKLIVNKNFFFSRVKYGFFPKKNYYWKQGIKKNRFFFWLKCHLLTSEMGSRLKSKQKMLISFSFLC